MAESAERPESRRTVPRLSAKPRRPGRSFASPAIAMRRTASPSTSRPRASAARGPSRSHADGARERRRTPPAGRLRPDPKGPFPRSCGSRHRQRGTLPAKLRAGSPDPRREPTFPERGSSESRLRSARAVAAATRAAVRPTRRLRPSANGARQTAPRPVRRRAPARVLSSPTRSRTRRRRPRRGGGTLGERTPPRRRRLRRRLRARPDEVREAIPGIKRPSTCASMRPSSRIKSLCR